MLAGDALLMAHKKLPEKAVEKAFNGVQLLVLAICVFNIIRNIQ